MIPQRAWGTGQVQLRFRREEKGVWAGKRGFGTWSCVGMPRPIFCLGSGSMQLTMPFIIGHRSHSDSRHHCPPRQRQPFPRVRVSQSRVSEPAPDLAAC
eukprot:3001494-Rhodomonas_salina.2